MTVGGCGAQQRITRARCVGKVSTSFQEKSDFSRKEIEWEPLPSAANAGRHDVAADDSGSRSYLDQGLLA